MSYKIILANGTISDSSLMTYSYNKLNGFLTFQVQPTNPIELYTKFGNPEVTKMIKVVHFIEKSVIITEADGSRHIETTVEQDPKVKIFKTYTSIHAIEKADDGDDAWELTLSSNETPEPETVLEIYEEDKPTAETGGTANDESPTE